MRNDNCTDLFAQMPAKDALDTLRGLSDGTLSLYDDSSRISDALETAIKALEYVMLMEDDCK